ncbi:MAG: BamA/TamA family outer membrane protein [Acidobacteria bacterium]|nr:BamA/TamA family outer membrane protein [Acidobacteriota bacterium]
MTVLALVLAAQVMAAAPLPQVERIASVVVHGNHTTPTDDVLAIAGDVTGQPATDALITAVGERLRQSGRFAGVDVRKRFLSIDDPTRVLLVIVVDEHAGVSEDDLTPGPMKRLTASGMWLPVVEFREGYGFTYGARVSFVDRLGPRSRISVPLTWGGERQAQVELERSFTGHALARVVGGGGIARRENPHFELGDVRRTLWARVESAPLPWLRTGAGTRLSEVSFGAIDDRLTTVGADVTLDTRVDPALPRNAVFVSLGIERLGFGSESLGASAAPGAALSARRVTVDARGYVGLVRQAVLALRAQSVAASRALPVFEQALVGGGPSLRGYRVGQFAGDNMVAFSTELIVPLTSPLDIGRFGVKLFADRAVAYAAGETLADQPLYWGYGVGAFVNATVFTLGVDVGWREGRGRPNAHATFGVRLR